MKNIKAIFIKGAIGDDNLFHNEKPHIAFMGRSNVGKSSLINALVGNKSLARSSSTPGKTLEINIFEINSNKYLLDFPGFGYAKTGQEQREQIRGMILWYLTVFKKDFRRVMLVIDAKAGFTEYDEQIVNMCRDNQIDFYIAVNKIDKLNQSEVAKLKNDLEGRLLSGKYVLCSTTKKDGIEEILSILNL